VPKYHVVGANIVYKPMLGIYSPKKCNMKKLSFIAILFISSMSFGQTFQIGAKAGVNISNFSGSSNVSEVKANSLVGFHAGGFVSFQFGELLALQPEVLFSTQGAKVDDAGTTTDFKVNYINIPVMVKLRFVGGLYVEAGPQIGFKANETISGSTQKFFNSTDLSIAGGLGFHSKMGLGFGARYTAGLSKVSDYSNGSTKPDWKNGVIQVSAFYTIFNNSKN
jgi:hypothetical protein